MSDEISLNITVNDTEIIRRLSRAVEVVQQVNVNGHLEQWHSLYYLNGKGRLELVRPQAASTPAREDGEATKSQ